MNFNKLADLLFPDVHETLEDLDNKYPKRNLSVDAVVTRLGPSPTGFMHIGNLYGAIIGERMSHQSGGTFFLRIEDTDDKRKVEGAEEVIQEAFRYFEIPLDEGILATGEKGQYGPYRQSERKEIYHVVAKFLVKQGFAYPSFATTEELEEIHEQQIKEKVDPGYYGKWATDRHLSLEEVETNLGSGKEWTLRLRSRALIGDGYAVPDGIRGSVTVHPNKLDTVLLKTNGIPTYHFAHVVDDHYMRVTHVVRGEEWLATLPIHLELFDILGWEHPVYCHTAHLMKIDEDRRRKLSKRKDPEMSLSYYMEKGYHPLCVKEYIMILINSNYEQWRLDNPEMPFTDFIVQTDKMATSGALYDVVKLDDTAKETLLRVSEEAIADFLIIWAEKYNNYAYQIMLNHREDIVKLLAIGRDGNKPRKDLIYAEQIWQHIAYFFDETFKVVDSLPDNISKEDASLLLTQYLAQFDIQDDNSTWFGKVRDLSEAYGYAGKPKEYKKNPEAYKGHVGDVSALIRLALTGHVSSPDLWSIQQVMGKDKVQTRIEEYLEKKL